MFTIINITLLYVSLIVLDSLLLIGTGSFIVSCRLKSITMNEGKMKITIGYVKKKPF